ncbi:MAG TPA: PqqD family protein, partial [Blastocatellia bacterium]|nr:PqqD family protein [Blastocatellia bacterium]
MERVTLPPRLRVWNQKEWYIYFDPYNFAWVRVNESGRLLLDLFRKYMSIAQVSSYIANKFGMAPDQAEESVRSFVNGLVAVGFLHLNEYRERPRFEFPKLDFPHDIYMHMTNKCNLKCPYCYNKDDRET